MREPSSVVVARGPKWEEIQLGPARVDLVYGRRLTWRANDEELADLIAQRVIARWGSLGIPHAGPDVSATAVVVPKQYFAGVPAVAPLGGPPYMDFVERDIGYQIVGPLGFGTCAWDRRTASACLSNAADRSAAVEGMVQHLWGAAVMFHPPLYALHAAAVVGPDGGATLLLGDSGVGKSSLAAYLALRHGFRYLTDDLTMVDGRSLTVYGRPWRLEVRPGAMEALWAGAAPDGVAHGDKLVLDARAHVPVVTSARVTTIVFLRRGAHGLTRVDTSDTLARLGVPRTMFGACPGVLAGYGEAFAGLAAGARAFSLGVDHSLGIPHASAAVVDAVSA